MQGESRGQLPKNLSEFSDAISQTKKKLYGEYDALAKNAGEGGAFVSTEWIINELKHLENNRTLRLANPGIDGIISNMKKGLEEIGTLTVEEAQTFSQHLNQNLKAFYKNWNANDIGRSTVEALVNNNLKKAIDESIENALGQGERYSGLKRQYGQLRSIEEEVAKRALVDQRKNAKNLFDLTDIYSANQVIDSLANLNPIGLIKWGATSLIKNWYKKLNDPNVQIKKLFENIDKEISQNGKLRKKWNRWTDTEEWINEKLGRKEEIDNQKKSTAGKEPTSADGTAIDKDLDKLREWAETTQELTLYRGLKEGGKKKFSFDAYTDSKKVARWYGEKIITEKISPKKLADFSNPSDELLQIIKDNWKGGKWYDIERLRKLATAEKFSAGTNMYEIFDDIDVRNALKNAGYDYVKFNDFGKDVKPHTTYFPTDAESRWSKSKVLNENSEEKMVLRINRNLTTDYKKLSQSAINKLKNSIVSKKNIALTIWEVNSKVEKMLKNAGIQEIPTKHTITRNGVKHILDNHGVWSKRLRGNEIPVKMEDIGLIPSIINNPDKISISPSKTKGLRRNAVVYEKKIGDHYYYVESVNKTKGTLETQTMYINK